MATIYWKMTADASHDNDYILYLRNASASGYTAWTTTSTGQTTPGWYYATGRTDIYKVVIETAIAPTTCYFWFNDCKKLETIQGISNLNTSSVGNMMYMFNNCRALTALDVSGFNTSNVTTMRGMFSFCKSLASLDVSNFDTSSVTSMEEMFQSCESLTSLDVLNFDTSKVTDMRFMFFQCFLLTSLDLSSFNTANVTNMEGMFQSCWALASLDVSDFNTSSVTNISYMFSGCDELTSLDVSNFNTSSVTDMAGMFQSCRALTSLDVSNFDTANVTDIHRMFSSCRALTSLDVSNFDTANVTNMEAMFEACYSLSSLDLSNFNTANVTNMSYMFSSCYELTSLDVSNFDTSNVTNMEAMFQSCRALATVPVAIPQNVTNVINCFRECTSLTGNVEVYNTPTSYTNIFTKTENDIYIIYRGQNISQAWTDIASQYSNIHYEANDNTIPSLSMRVIRVNSASSETQSEIGEYAYISATVVVYGDHLPVGWTDSLGTKTLTKDGTTISPTWTQTVTDNTYTLKCWVSLGDIAKHTFALQATDDIKDANNTTRATHQSLLVTQSLSKAYKLVDYYHESDPNNPNYDTEGMAVGKFATEANLFDVDMPSRFRDSVTVDHLVGEIKMWAGNTAPNGWLVCDGSAISRTDYPLLFDAIGTLWGAGDGSTTFNLPNLMGRVPVGYDASDADFDTVGESGGAKTVTLDISQIPAHHHKIPSQVFRYVNKTSLNAKGTTGAKTFSEDSNLYTENAGSGGAHNNLQPYAVVKYIICAV